MARLPSCSQKIGSVRAIGLPSNAGARLRAFDRSESLAIELLGILAPAQIDARRHQIDEVARLVFQFVLAR